MKIQIFRHVSILLVCACLGLAGRVGADAVADWNGITVQAVATATAAGRPGAAVVLLDFAMVHIAIHDAVQAYDGQFEPYHTEISNANGSPVAAIAKAAHDVLVSRFPDQTTSLDTQYSTYLVNNGLSENDPGVAVGQLAAAGIIALRANDGSFPPNPPAFLGGTDPGVWRPTPPGFSPGTAPWLGAVTPFALESTDQCHPDPQPSLSSNRYAKEYKEVKKLGSVMSTKRTDKQTDLANFWSDNIVQKWSVGLRDIAAANITNLADSARLFALVYISNADAGICAWESKYFFVFWRPVTAIQEGDNDGNSKTDGDPTWLPLLTTPPYPDYTSGANNVSGSTTRTLRHFFGTNHLDFTLTSTFPPTIQKTRAYKKFSKAADEVVDARVLQGIHFRFADKTGREQGEKVADYVFENFLRPLD